ncbi:MAG TPA: hypothetical protein VHZ97_27620, partial [Pseudonocardiaceae bacterium]|nr:hypothetical protein [Pseudonocardiaceae bacterium]
PDEAEADTVEDTALPTAPANIGDTNPGARSTDRTRSGVLVAPAPTGKSARHRAGRGRRALILAKPRSRPKPASADSASAPEAASTTTQLPLVEQLRNTPKNLRILVMTATAVLLISIGFGMVRPATQLTGTPTPAGPNSTGGMQHGTLPDAALSGTPTTTVVPPPTTAPPATTTPPTHHATTTHAAPPPVTSTENTQSGNTFDEPGQPCSQPGQFGIDSNYQPVECAGDRSGGGLTWHEFGN